ncbi:BGTF surface domain-containing protein [Haloferax marisrubri]|uniref:PGF-CTERM sorting domain-containing protein n=1 Tax=Haloferax marisrubri TaxID=1544719 RepID=A0A2P4NRR3_9EURY|nr:BGTF surface domain-containing protein [Haloferax marisrubri]POG55836.1 PGF-CTERM sorting domain-containing protein [Haloferax marisrubri]
MTRNKQIRAVLLAALMVFSVFAGSIAFTGSAAAAATSINTTTVSGSSATVNVTVDATAGDNNTTVWIDLDDDGTLDSGEPVATNDSYTPGTATDVLVSGLDVSDLTAGQYELAAAETAGAPVTGTTSEDLSVTATVTNNDDPELVSAVHYNDNFGNDVLELSFNEEVQNLGGNIQVYQDDVDVTSDVVASGPTQNNPGQVIINTTDLYTGDLVVNLEGVEDTEGNQLEQGLDDDYNSTITVATVTVTDDNSVSITDAYMGEVVAATNGNIGTAVEVESDETQDDVESFFRSGSTGATSAVYTFNTADRQEQRYNVTIGSTLDEKIRVRDLGLEVSIDDLNVTDEDEIEGTVSANSDRQDVEITLLDSDGDEVDDGSMTVNLNGQGEYDFEFNASELDLDTGDYTVEVTDTASGVTVESDTITVEDAGEGSADFAESVITEQRGDVVAIPVTVENTDTATVSIGSNDQGYVANVTVEDGNDDGEVILLWDSSKSTVSGTNNPSNVFDVDDSDDDILTGSDGVAEVGLATSNLVDAGDYDLEIRTGSTVSDSENVATLVLEEGGVSAVRTWTAPSGESLTDLEEVTDALENGNITEDSQIAFGDKVVVQIEASGLEGTVDAQDDETPDFFDTSNGYDDSYRLTINQTNPDPNRDPKIINVANASVVADSDNDTYFVVFESEQIQAYRDDDDDGVLDSGEITTSNEVDLDDDDSFNVEFKMIGEDDVSSSLALVDDNSSAEDSYEFLEAEHSFDADPVNVTNAAEQTVTGSSNVAPGTELTLRVESDGDTQPRFLKTATVYVQADGTFSGSFDFSEQSVGDTFTVTADGGVASDEEVDGNVVESVDTTTDEPTETTTDEPTETTTDEPTETTTSEPTETTTAEPTDETTTSSQTPGFGVIVALVALVAAALLAVRRDN